MAVAKAGSCSSNSTTSLGTSMCQGCSLKNTKKKKHTFDIDNSGEALKIFKRSSPPGYSHQNSESAALCSAQYMHLLKGMSTS